MSEVPPGRSGVNYSSWPAIIGVLFFLFALYGFKVIVDFVF